MYNCYLLGPVGKSDYEPSWFRDQTNTGSRSLEVFVVKLLAGCLTFSMMFCTYEGDYRFCTQYIFL